MKYPELLWKVFEKIRKEDEDGTTKKIHND